MEIKPDFLNKAPIAKIRRQLLGNKDKPCGWPIAAILAAQRSPQKSEQRPVGKNGIFKWELGDSSCNPLTYSTPFSVQRLGTSSDLDNRRANDLSNYKQFSKENKYF